MACDGCESALVLVVDLALFLGSWTSMPFYGAQWPSVELLASFHFLNPSFLNQEISALPFFLSLSKLQWIHVFEFPVSFFESIVFEPGNLGTIRFSSISAGFFSNISLSAAFVLRFSPPHLPSWLPLQPGCLRITVILIAGRELAILIRVMPQATSSREAVLTLGSRPITGS